ncbi:DNA repair protein RadC [Clostridium pascui]|uniref:RadC family protein n=1 Tax=Clostridium pascui TaxID=46609 RepID=UPI0019564D56|nr:DNA repair protein RadC [Clostridium pascui]MBM7872250.1 DNA repair protein RadC [Clostridium pascui]
MCNYENLSNRELLKLMVMERSTESTIDDLLKKFPSLPALLLDADESELKSIKGIGEKKAQQIRAISELIKRLYNEAYTNNTYKISQPLDCANLVMAELRYLKQEILKVVLLNTKNIVIDVITVSMGSLNSSIVHPREVFLQAIRKSAAFIIVCHNHPSGDPNPSQEDINITKRLKECGKLLGIDLLDHLIIGDGKYISLKERELI